MNKNSIFFRWLFSVMLVTFWWSGNAQTLDGSRSADLIPGPGVTINTPVLDMGFRPIGAWMEPARLSITNNPGDGDAVITGADINNNYDGFLKVVTPALPYELGIGETTTEFGITTNNTDVNEGNFNGTMAVMYNNSRIMTTVDYTGHAYIPVEGDVWETADVIELNGGDYSIANTGRFPSLFKNYILPNDLTNPDVFDYVSKVVLTNDAILNITPISGTVNVAIYSENFNGEGGPMAHNALYQTSSAIVNYPLFAGTYYIVGSGDDMSQLVFQTTNFLDGILIVILMSIK